MAYVYTEFDGVALPLYQASQNHDAAPIESSLLDSVGGKFDYHGATRKRAHQNTISLTGDYVGEMVYLVDEAGNQIVDEAGNTLIVADARTRLRDQVEQLRAKSGTRGALWRERQNDDARQWITARLLTVTHPRQEDIGLTATISCTWESLMDAWHAESATVTSGTAPNGSALSLAVHNGGAVTVQDAVLTITRTSGTITSVRIVNVAQGVDWTWTGSIGASQALTIDCGAKTMRIGSADAYSQTRAAGHTARGWCPLGVGMNTVTVTVTGGDATVSVSHYNQWT